MTESHKVTQSIAIKASFKCRWQAPGPCPGLPSSLSLLLPYFCQPCKHWSTKGKCPSRLLAVSQGPPVCSVKVGNYLAACRIPASGLPAHPGQQSLLCHQKHSHVVVGVGGGSRWPWPGPVLTEKYIAIPCWDLESFCQQLRLGGKRQRFKSKARKAVLTFKPLQGCRGSPVRKCLRGWGAVVPTISTALGRVDAWSLTDSTS